MSDIIQDGLSPAEQDVAISNLLHQQGRSEDFIMSTQMMAKNSPDMAIQYADRKENPLAKVEELVEGNYNQIDGIINNMPPVEEHQEEKEMTFKERIAQAKEQSSKTEQSKENKKELMEHFASALQL